MKIVHDFQPCNHTISIYLHKMTDCRFSLIFITSHLQFSIYGRAVGHYFFEKVVVIG